MDDSTIDPSNPSCLSTGSSNDTCIHFLCSYMLGKFLLKGMEHDCNIVEAIVH